MRIKPARLKLIRDRLLPILLGLCSLAPLPVAAQASGGGQQPAVEVPANLTHAEVRDLVARLSDDEVRALIIQQLDKQAATDATDSNTNAYLEQLGAGLAQARQSFARAFDTSNKPLRNLAANIWRQLTENGNFTAGRLLLQLLVLLAAGVFADWLVRRLLRRTAAGMPGEMSLRQKFDFACYGGAVAAIGIAAFAAGAIAAIEFMTVDMPEAQLLWYRLVWLIVVVRLVMLVVSRLVSPASRATRLLTLSDPAAREAWTWSLLLVLSLAVPRQLGRLVGEFGASDENRLLLAVLLGPIFLAVAVALVLRLRDYGARLIAGDGGRAGMLRQGLARAWWVLAIVYILMIWLMAIGKSAATGESTLGPGLGSLALVAAIPYLDRALQWLIAFYFDDKAAAKAGAAGQAEAIETPPETTTRKPRPAYQGVALRYARILLTIAILVTFVRLWNIDLAALSAQLVGERFARASFDIGITILLTWALWGVIRIAIERKIAEDKGPAGDSEEAEAGGVGGTRIGTVLPLIRAFIQITLIVMAVLISLSSLGVNIGPLIAGAGVVGLAIGFGAQTLVRDIVSGFFYLVDDAFRIGEYVVVDQTRGTVEKISIRSFQLRHHNGPVHTIPYGEIRTLTNWSRDWAIMKFELRIPFETDIEQVRKIIKKIGQDLMADETFGPLLLAPLKSQGVNRMDDSALIIRCKFTAVPGQQYLIRREAFTRIQKAFEEQGIHFAPRRVLVEATTPQAAVEAAAAAIDREGEGEQQKSPDEP